MLGSINPLFVGAEKLAIHMDYNEKLPLLSDMRNSGWPLLTILSVT
jgi:hypothetical protein